MPQRNTILPWRLTNRLSRAELHDLKGLADEALIARAAQPRWGTSCLAELYERHLPRVVAWCQRVIGDEHEARDIAQEVFLRVASTLQSFREDSRFTTWLYVIARRTAIDHLRRQRSAAQRVSALQAEPVDESTTPEDDAQVAQTTRKLKTDLERLLAPDEAQVVYMHYSLGMTIPAITRSLGLTNASGAKAPLVAAMRKLRRHYNVSSGPLRSSL